MDKIFYRRLFSNPRRIKRFFLLASVVIITCVYVMMNPGQISRDDDFGHFKRSTNLQHYLDHIEILIDPTSVPCSDNMPTPLLVLVASAPSNFAERAVIRQTWGSHLHTFFFLGLEDVADMTMKIFNENAGDCYIEALQNNDIVGYKFRDHYQNLTLKSVLMLQWARARCPGATMLFKTDDDVILNPWTLQAVLEEHRGASLIGYMFNDTILHREEGHKWYIPRWMNVTDVVPHYLAGAGYFIKGDYVEPILEAAKHVPLINIEDIYITYLVSHLALKLNLTHDSRLSPYTPLFSSISCVYSNPALLHHENYKPEQRLYLWNKIEKAHDHDKDVKNLCDFYNKYIEDVYVGVILFVFAILFCRVMIGIVGCDF